MPTETRASLGHEGEPNIVGHTHLWVQGLPTSEPFTGVPLYGPEPGQLLNLKGPKVAWDSEKKKIVRDGLRKLITENIDLFSGKFKA